jgi:hypothetical protein
MFFAIDFIRNLLCQRRQLIFRRQNLDVWEAIFPVLPAKEDSVEGGEQP